MYRDRRWAVLIGAMALVSATSVAALPSAAVLPSGATIAAKKRRIAVTAARTPPPAVSPRATLPRATAPPAPAGGANPTVGGCSVFPADNAWNSEITRAAVHPMSATWVASVNANRSMLHPDTGSNPDYGIPYVVVPSSQANVAIRYTDYGDESDPGPFPIPADAPVEGGSDRHVIVLQSGTCSLFELYNARRTASGWDASSGARFDLRSNALRPAGWTSADAAGLPIFPGLLRFDEAGSGEIRHALRFTVSRTQRGYIAPARHFAGSNDPSLPPMGARFRLRADADLSGYHGQALVILRALQRYGMIVADNGSSWFISGASDSRWNDDDLGQLKRVPGAWFEVVDTGPIERG
jgi:hypothetical protein